MLEKIGRSNKWMALIAILTLALVAYFCVYLPYLKKDSNALSK